MAVGDEDRDAAGGPACKLEPDRRRVAARVDHDRFRRRLLPDEVAVRLDRAERRAGRRRGSSAVQCSGLSLQKFVRSRPSGRLTCGARRGPAAVEGRRRRAPVVREAAADGWASPLGPGQVLGDQPGAREQAPVSSSTDGRGRGFSTRRRLAAGSLAVALRPTIVHVGQVAHGQEDRRSTALMILAVVGDVAAESEHEDQEQRAEDGAALGAPPRRPWMTRPRRYDGARRELALAAVAPRGGGPRRLDDDLLPLVGLDDVLVLVALELLAPAPLLLRGHRSRQDSLPAPPPRQSTDNPTASPTIRAIAARTTTNAATFGGVVRLARLLEADPLRHLRAPGRVPDEREQQDRRPRRPRRRGSPPGDVREDEAHGSFSLRPPAPCLAAPGLGGHSLKLARASKPRPTFPPSSTTAPRGRGRGGRRGSASPARRAARRRRVAGARRPRSARPSTCAAFTVPRASASAGLSRSCVRGERAGDREALAERAPRG